MPPIAELDMRRATLCQLLHWLAADRVQPQVLADVYLEAIERIDPQLNSYVDVRGPDAGAGAHGRASAAATA